MILQNFTNNLSGLLLIRSNFSTISVGRARFALTRILLQVFVGNSDSHSVQYHGLSHPVTTSVVLLRPKEWHNNIGLRLELYGCLPGIFGIWLALFRFHFLRAHRDVSHVDVESHTTFA